MRHYETVPIPATTRKTLVKTTCDLCGAEAAHGDWESSYYEVNEVDIKVTIKQKDGHNFPEGGYGTEIMVDMCPDCFKNKLTLWLESQGCKTERTDWDW